MPTEMGSPLFAGWRSQKDAASVAALRQAGAVILGKTVTTEFAASEPRGTRNPWNLEHTPGGSSSGSAAAVGCRHDQRRSRHAGDRLDHPARRASAAAIGFKPRVGALNREGSHDYQSQSCTGILAATLPDAWQVAYEIAQRVGGDAGTPGLIGPERAPAPVKPRRLAFLETSGWAVASETAKASMQDALRRAGGGGCRDPHTRRTTPTCRRSRPKSRTPSRCRTASMTSRRAGSSTAAPSATRASSASRCATGSRRREA